MCKKGRLKDRRGARSPQTAVQRLSFTVIDFHQVYYLLVSALYHRKTAMYSKLRKGVGGSLCVQGKGKRGLGEGAE